MLGLGIKCVGDLIDYRWRVCSAGQTTNRRFLNTSNEIRAEVNPRRYGDFIALITVLRVFGPLKSQGLPFTNRAIGLPDQRRVAKTGMTKDELSVIVCPRYLI